MLSAGPQYEFFSCLSSFFHIYNSFLFWTFWEFPPNFLMRLSILGPNIWLISSLSLLSYHLQYTSQLIVQVIAPRAMASATTKFQFALPYVLSSVSPGLAALHAIRAQRAHDVDISYNSPRCPRCGASFLHGAGTIRIIRAKKSTKRHHGAAQPRSASRLLRYSCAICGSDEDIAVDSSSADVLSIPQPRKRKREAQHVPHMPSAITSLRIEKKPKTETDLAPSSVLPAKRQVPASTSVPVTAKLPATLSSSKPAEAASKTGSSHSKPKPKAKSTLQALLAKNREKQQQNCQENTQGLSAFLQEL